MPVRRRLCSEAASYSPYTGDTCDTELETVCTTILATKYVKVSSLYFQWMDGWRCCQYGLVFNLTYT